MFCPPNDTLCYDYYVRFCFDSFDLTSFYMNIHKPAGQIQNIFDPRPNTAAPSVNRLTLTAAPFQVQIMYLIGYMWLPYPPFSMIPPFPRQSPGCMAIIEHARPSTAPFFNNSPGIRACNKVLFWFLHQGPRAKPVGP